MGTVENVQDKVIIYGCWIYNYIHKMELPLIIYLFDLICFSTQAYGDMYAEFEVISYAVRYVNPKEKLKWTKEVKQYCYVHIHMTIYV